MCVTVISSKRVLMLLLCGREKLGQNHLLDIPFAKGGTSGFHKKMMTAFLSEMSRWNGSYSPNELKKDN